VAKVVCRGVYDVQRGGGEWVAVMSGGGGGGGDFVVGRGGGDAVDDDRGGVDTADDDRGGGGGGQRNDVFFPFVACGLTHTTDKRDDVLSMTHSPLLMSTRRCHCSGRRVSERRACMSAFKEGGVRAVGRTLFQSKECRQRVWRVQVVFAVRVSGVEINVLHVGCFLINRMNVREVLTCNGGADAQ
jgi:hypothetical protein